MLQEHDERESSHMGSDQWSAYNMARSDVWNMGTFSPGALPVLGSHGQACPKTTQAHPGSWGSLTLRSVAASMLHRHLNQVGTDAPAPSAASCPPCSEDQGCETKTSTQTLMGRLLGKRVISALCLQLGLSCLENRVGRLWM